MLKKEFQEIKSMPSDFRKFGLLVGGVLVFIAAFGFYKGRTYAPWFGGIGALLVILGLAAPRALKPLQRPWMMLAVVMGRVMSHVIMTFLFFVVVTPIALIARIFRKHFLELKIDKEAKTYWRAREPKKSAESYEHQF